MGLDDGLSSGSMRLFGVGPEEMIVCGESGLLGTQV